MINRDQLREYILKVIREELTVTVEHKPETNYDHAKICVSLNLSNGAEPWVKEEFCYSEDRMYGR